MPTALEPTPAVSRAPTPKPTLDRQTRLIVPAAVRALDLEVPITDLELPPGQLGERYRSLLAVIRENGDPLGAVTVAVDSDGRVSRGRLVDAIPWQPRHQGDNGMARRRRARGPSVSVVVTTCRNPVGLRRCLASVLASDYDEFEVIVVENRPGPVATAWMLAECFPNEPALHYLEERRFGLARARNRGLARADGEIVIFTDDDVVVDPLWIRRCAEAFGRADDAACVTGLILPRTLETESQLLLERFAGFGKGFHRRTFRLEQPSNGELPVLYTPGAIGSGANTAVRSGVAARLGGFDARLGAGTPAAGGEDLDLYIRILREGHSVVYEPSAIVWHEHPQGMERLRRQVYRYGVGLGATMAKQLVAGPDRRGFLGAVPAGVRYARDPSSRKNAGKTSTFPRHLTWMERLGMLIGPLAYLLSALTDAVWRAPMTLHARAAALGARAPGRERASTRRDGAVAFASSAARRLAVVGTGACVAAPLLVALGLPPALSFPAVLVLLCLAPGLALITWLRGALEPGLVLGASLAVSALVAQSMLWLGVWWPQAFLFAVALVCLPPLVRGLASSGLGRVVRPLPGPGTLARIPRPVLGHGALLVAALLAWGISLAQADVSQIDGFGLLSALPPSYFFAFALLLAGFGVAVTRDPPDGKILAAYVFALVLLVHGSTPLLYDEPRYQWVYNHLAVIDLIEQGGGVDRDLDIYNNWPGFFALNAWLSGLTGLSPAAYAPWAPVFFNLANLAALRFALRGLTRDERLLWIAAILFVLGNWVGQDYLAPQAFAFLLSLVALGLCLRCAPPKRRRRDRDGRFRPARLDALRRRLEPLKHRLIRRPAPRNDGRPSAPFSPQAAVIVGGLVFLAVVVSHQLSPIILLLSVAALAVTVGRLPLWIPVSMALVELAWLALAWPYVSQHWSLFDPDPAASATPPGYTPGNGLSGLSFVIWGARVDAVLIAGLAGLGLVRRLRAGYWDVAAVTLAAAPVLVVGAQSYGGEGPYRVYLFALPWLCFFAAASLAPAHRASLPRVLREWRLGLAVGGSAACLLFAAFGLEFANRVNPRDIAAAEWFEKNVPQDSLLVQVTGNSISRITHRYATSYETAYTNSPELTDRDAYLHRSLGHDDLSRLEKTLGNYGAQYTFLILNSGQERFAKLYGILPPGWRRSLERALDGSRSFQPVYSNRSSSIYEYFPPGSRQLRQPDANRSSIPASRP